MKYDIKLSNTKIKLYIPFWIYSNGVTVRCNFITIKLYIPFWIYSNTSKPVQLSIPGELYIPFWIYSNSTTQAPHTILFMHFTFHSGYIPMLEDGISDAAIINFTFHSGYIPIKFH